LTVSWSTPSNQADSITLTITGSASLGEYQAILAGVQYVDTKTGHQDTSDRIINVVTNDGTLDSEVHTVTITNTSYLPHGPVIGTDQFTVIENVGGTTTVAGLYVIDIDATVPDDAFTMTAEALAASPDGGVTPDQDTGSFAHINSTLAAGVTYDPGSNPPATDMVTLTVADGHGHSDIVNFIFNQAGPGPSVTLNGTSEKDVIFATGNNDILTGGAKADQFVFNPEDGPSSDTITDFDVAEDHIDLRAFSAIDGMADITVASQGSDTLITLEGNNTILLQHVHAANVQASHFIFHA
jgi:Ca2+-binding RTX toxin-like protein